MPAPGKPEALSFRSRFIGEESASGSSTTDSSRDVTALRNDNEGAAGRAPPARARTLAPTSNPPRAQATTIASSAGLFLISTVGPLVEISDLVRNSVSARVT